MNYENMYVRMMHIANTINNLRTDMKSYKKCVAIYLQNKRIVSIGVNKTKTHPLLLKFQYHTNHYFSMGDIHNYNKKSKSPEYPIHAELDGYIKLLNLSIDFNTLFIYRGDNCNLASSPCHVCTKWLKRINKLKVCCIDNDGNFQAINSVDLIGHKRKRFAVYKTFSQ